MALIWPGAENIRISETVTLSGLHMASVVDLYRYPVKGLSPERLESISLFRAHGLPWDREFALALGTTAFDPSNPEPLDKGFFLMLRNNEMLAALTTRYDMATDLLTIEKDGDALLVADTSMPDGRDAIENFFEKYIGAAAKGRPRLVRAQDHKFTDASVMSPTMMRAISVINLASVKALKAATGETVHPLRFRGNIYLDGLQPWEELKWVDQDVKVGGVRFKGLARTPRCAAVNVNPQTAQRDTNIPKSLQKNFGHVDLGVYLETLDDGVVRIGDMVAVGSAV
jgi:uncharacterized protein YcbX